VDIQNTHTVVNKKKVTTPAPWIKYY